ncbi:MAG: ADP-ribosylglycohydrolase family protein [Chitinispirillaceae bacterium]|jgi:poly(ADP-ribose) glycohydrolase ARH3
MAKSVQYPLQKIEGMLFGIFLGDAIGASFNGWLSEDIPPLDSNYVISHPPRTYTDDMQMSISVFEEMLENGCINQSSLLQRFLKRFSPWRGYGGGMLEVIEQWRDGRDIESAARSMYGGVGSFGDGAAMRVAPISAFFKLHEVMELIEQVRLSSMLTHTHPLGIAGAVLQAYAVLLALNDVPNNEWLTHLFSFPTESIFKIKLETIKKCLERQSSSPEGAREIGNGSDALEAVPAALFAVIRHPDSFSEAVLGGVSMGGDTDTIGAMAGAIAGARFGIKGIPQEWLVNLENGVEGKDFIFALAKKAVASLAATEENKN